MNRLTGDTLESRAQNPGFDRIPDSGEHRAWLRIDPGLEPVSVDEVGDRFEEAFRLIDGDLMAGVRDDSE